MSAAERVRWAREECEMQMRLRKETEADHFDASASLDAFAAAVRAETLAEVAVMVDSFPSYDLDRGMGYGCSCDMKKQTGSWPGEWLDRDDLRATLTTLETPK